MNLDKFKEIIDVSTHVDVIEDYEIRRYKNNGGYIIIDALGDFVVLTDNCVEGVCGAIFGDLMKLKTILVN
tara:strand:- start:1010 stop:1222 length:213 start_codon:yes stop_codon:yes gene_type:complete